MQSAPALVKSEIEVASDVLMALHHARLLRENNAESLGAAARLFGVSLQDLRDAEYRRERRIAARPKLVRG